MSRSSLVAAMALLSLRLSAQELPFTHFTPNDQVTPLSSASVQKIVQDHLGYIWFAFYSTGLTRYDGRTMEDYGTTDGLDDLTVREIVEDAGHRLWVGSESGLVVSEKPLEAYEPGQRVHFVDSVGGIPLPRTRIRRNCIVAGQGGWLWVGELDGVQRLRVRGNHLERGSVDALHSGVSCVLARRSGDVVVAFNDGRNLVFDSDGHIRGTIPVYPPVPLGALAESRDGRLWGGSFSGEVWVLENGIFHVISRDIDERIVAILETSRGELWIATLGAGAERINLAHPEDRQLVRRDNGLIGDTLWCLLEDREGNLWFGQNGGASRLRADYDAFQALTGRTRTGGTPLLPDPSAFASAPPGGSGPFARYTWAGTGGGLAGIVNNRREITLTAKDGLLNNSIYALSRDDAGRLWIGNVGGVNCLSPPGSEPPAMPGMTRRTIAIGDTRATLTGYPLDITYDARQYAMSPQGPGMWFAGNHGVSCTIGGRWYLFGPDSGLPPTGGTSVAVDDDGYVWVGTTDTGLYRSIAPFQATLLDKTIGPDRESKQRFFAAIWNRATGAPSDSVRTLLWYDQHLWAGTAGGLVVLSTVPFAPLANLPSRVIGGSMVVGFAVSPVTGNVWVSQNAGLVEIEPRNFRVISRVNKSDGLLNDEAWAYGPVATASDGRVYLSTPTGLSIFDPLRRRANGTPPIVRFRHVESVEDWRGHNEIAFEYAALAFGDESGVRYRTRMIGYDDWSPERRDSRIRYTNLPAAFFAKRYTFAVRARNGDGVWSPETITWDFEVMPALWLRWWAILTYVALILLGGWVINRLRTAQLQRRNRALEDLVLARTEEIRAQAHELETIDTIVEIINRELALENVLKSILEQAMRLLPHAQKAIFLQLDHERNRNEVLAAVGYDLRTFENIDLTPDEAVRRYSENAEQIEEGVYIVREGAFASLTGNDKLAHVPRPRTMLAMAVTIAGRIEGFFVFDNFTDPNAFSSSDLHKLARLREHAISAITKARTLRQLELKSREAEEANQAKSRFLANMSHELRTPMNAIIGFSEVLTERLEGAVDAKSVGFLRSILSSGRHLLEIINDILDLSKVEAGKMEIFPETFSMPAAIESVCQVMRGFAARSGITFSLEIAPDVTDIETDQAKFKQILYNLLSNSVKFSPSDSAVTIRARRVEPAGRAPESIEVQVIDRGIGIAREHLDVIFDEFRQIDATTARRYGGTGLGLSLVRKFVELQQGSVSVESGVGMGSTFTITLPRRFAGAKIPSPIVNPDGTVVPPGQRVLVIESDDASFSTLSTYLRAAAFVPIRARRADEALRLARTMKPVAIALDVMLAGSDGWEVLRRLKSEEATSAIPAVVISANDNRDLGISLGADGYFTRPLDWSMLIRRMRELTKAA